MCIKSLDEYVIGVKSGDRFFLAKTITLLESTCVDHRKMSVDVVERLLSSSGGAVRIGITGVPGVGKSTFIESFGIMLADIGYKVAVLAIDPSSVNSGGSIMADKTRMERLSSHPNAFIRPSPSSGVLGGVSRMTGEVILVCEAAGFDVIIVETVGVGQSEVAVASMVDFFLVLMLSGAGDEIQGIKKGVLEFADALAINKSDGDNLIKAEQTKKSYESALHLLRPRNFVWVAPVVTCSALTSFGLSDIWNMILDHREKMLSAGEFFKKRKKQSVDWMQSMVKDCLMERFFGKSNIKVAMLQITNDVENKKISPIAGAEKLLSLFGG